MYDIYQVFGQLVKKIASEPSSLDEENADLLENVLYEMMNTIVVKATIDQNDHLILKYTNGIVRDLGNVNDSSTITSNSTLSIEIIDKNTIGVRKSDRSRAIMKANDDGSATITYYAGVISYKENSS